MKRKRKGLTKAQKLRLAKSAGKIFAGFAGELLRVGVERAMDKLDQVEPREVKEIEITVVDSKKKPKKKTPRHPRLVEGRSEAE